VSASPASLPPGDLRAVADAARAGGRIALDTEFIGEGRYRTLLCLIQLAVPQGAAGERIELIDPLASDLDGEPLAHVLADPEIQIVVHAGRQDVALLRRRLGTEVSNVFDTQVAAGFAGLAAQSSYDALLGDMLGVRLAKSASFTRWDARPLTAEQLAYAREDVVHLLALASELERRLAALGRLQWAREECEPLARASDERDLDTVFARLPRIKGLSAASRAIARELLEWRERTAAAQDRPVQSVLADAVLLEIAKRRPASERELDQIRGAGAARRRARDLLDAVARGPERPPVPSPQDVRPPPPQPDDMPLIALCEALVRARAREAGLAYELLASRADLQSIVLARRLAREAPGGADGRADGRADVRTLRGWRAELVGDELLALLDGRLSLSVQDGRLRIAP
jgi:ribonuclease D